MEDSPLRISQESKSKPPILKANTRPGKHTKSHGNWPFILGFPIKNGDFPWLCGSLPEGNVVETMTFAPSPSHHHKYIGGFSTYHSQEVMGWFIKPLFQPLKPDPNRQINRGSELRLSSPYVHVRISLILIQWIGFVGKILTGNPWLFTIK